MKLFQPLTLLSVIVRIMFAFTQADHIVYDLSAGFGIIFDKRNR